MPPVPRISATTSASIWKRRYPAATLGASLGAERVGIAYPQMRHDRRAGAEIGEVGIAKPRRRRRRLRIGRAGVRGGERGGRRGEEESSHIMSRLRRPPLGAGALTLDCGGNSP